MTGLSPLDSGFSLLYMPSPNPLEFVLVLLVLVFFSASKMPPLDDRFVVFVSSKSFTIVHAHPSQFITTSELILEDFQEASNVFWSQIVYSRTIVLLKIFS